MNTPFHRNGPKPNYPPQKCGALGCFRPCSVFELFCPDHAALLPDHEQTRLAHLSLTKPGSETLTVATAQAMARILCTKTWP